MKKFFKAISKIAPALFAAIAGVAAFVYVVASIDSSCWMENFLLDYFPNLYNLITPFAELIQNVTGTDHVTAYSTGILSLALVIIPSIITAIQGEKTSATTKLIAPIGAIATIVYGHIFFEYGAYDVPSVAAPIMLTAIAASTIASILNRRSEHVQTKRELTEQIEEYQLVQEELTEKIEDYSKWELLFSEALSSDTGKNEEPAVQTAQ